MIFLLGLGTGIFVCRWWYKRKIKKARTQGYNEGYQDAYTDAFENEVNSYPQNPKPMPYDYAREQVKELIDKIDKNAHK